MNLLSTPFYPRVYIVYCYLMTCRLESFSRQILGVYWHEFKYKLNLINAIFIKSGIK